MAQHLQIREDGTIDIGWNDVNRVLPVLGYSPIPNHTSGMLTFWNRWRKDGIVIQRENRYNVDYFLEIIELVGIPPNIFLQIAFGREEDNNGIP
jgi:hypothetical protein